MAITNDDLARRAGGEVQLRTTPLRMRWELTGMTTSDGHRLQGTFTCSVLPLPDRNNRAMLEETFLSHAATVPPAAVVAHFSSTLTAAATKTALTASGAQWLGDDSVDQKDKAASADVRRVMVDAIRQAADAVAFSSGLEILEPLQLELDSPTFRQQKTEAMERALAEKRVAGQVEHLEKAMALLKQFQAMQQDAPQLTPSAVLQQVSPTDRGTMLQTLLLAAGRQHVTQFIWLVAGPYLVRVERPLPLENSPPPHVELITLPTGLGPLRSVEPARMESEPVLLVGARNGVIIVNPDGRNPRLFSDAQITSQLGFSRALLFNNCLWACHSEAGVVRWNLDRPYAPAAALRPAQLSTLFQEQASVPASAAVSGESRFFEPVQSPAVRHLTVLDETRLIACFGSNLLTVDVNERTAAVSTGNAIEIVAVVADDKRLLIVNANGCVRVLDRSTLQPLGEINRGSRIVAAGALPWLGSTRLLLAGDGPIQCIGMDDPLISEFLSAHRAPRQVAGATDLVAAISADRQRLILWNGWDSQRPISDIAITAIARHRIADIDFS